MGFSLTDIMEAIADELIADGVTDRAHAYPVGSVSVPCAVVGYPEAIDFDLTFGDASHKLVFPVWFVAGAVMEKATRDTLSAIIDGTASVKVALDGDLSGTVQSCRVTDAMPESVVIGDVTYMAIKFNLEVLS